MKERKDPTKEAQEWLAQNAQVAQELGGIAVVSPEEQARIAEDNSRLGHNGNTDQPKEL